MAGRELSVVCLLERRYMTAMPGRSRAAHGHKQVSIGSGALTRHSSMTS